MTLAELIAALEAADPNLVVPQGFTNPHSYRGYYEDLAFEPAANVTVDQMLTDARFALGACFQGWKGGDYEMSEYTDCWLAARGALGETLGPLLLQHLLAASEAERRVRAKVAAEIEETIDADVPGEYEAGLTRAARIARGGS